MNRKKVIIVFLIVLLAAVGMDILESRQGNIAEIKRQEPGQEDEEVHLTLNAGEVLKDYSYSLKVEAQKVTKSQAKEYFSLAKKEIDETFCGKNSSKEHITEPVCILETYQEGLVSATWSFDNYELIDGEGKILEEALVSEGTLVNAQVELSCGDYTELYSFGFVLYPKEQTPQQEILSKILDTFETQMVQEGEDTLQLPQEIEGLPLTWEKEKTHYALKVLVFGVVILVLLKLSEKEKLQKAEERRKQQMELEYPEIVSKMLILLGSGMSISQVWNKISAQYSDKREKNRTEKQPAYEEMLRTWREIEDGESERKAIENFGKRTQVRCFHRLSQLLVQSMEKGGQGIYEQLEQEAEDSFRERKQAARKMGEEAGTKLLLPMIMMLGVVMAIVIVPAFLKF